MNSVLADPDSASFSSLTHYPPSAEEPKSHDMPDLSNCDPSWEASISSLFSNCPDSQASPITMGLENPTSSESMDNLEFLLSPTAESSVSPHLYTFPSFSGEVDSFVDSSGTFPFFWEGSPMERLYTLSDARHDMTFESSNFNFEESQEQLSSISISCGSQQNSSASRATSAKPPPVPKGRSRKTSEEIARTRTEIRRARAARNRASARRSRLRKKAENQLEMETAISVQRQNASLKRRVLELRDKASNLRKVALALGLAGELEQTEMHFKQEAASQASEIDV